MKPTEGWVLLAFSGYPRFEWSGGLRYLSIHPTRREALACRASWDVTAKIVRVRIEPVRHAKRKRAKGK